MSKVQELQAEVARLKNNNEILQRRIDRAHKDVKRIDPDKSHDVIMKHVEELGEFFDTVLIHCASYQPDGGTAGFHLGTGCGYSRKALAEEYIDRDFADILNGGIFVTEHYEGEDDE